jgi:thioredoxin-related protein
VKRRAACIAIAAGLPGLAIPVHAAQELALLASFQADAALAAGKGRPLVLFFSLPGCRYCDQLRRHYLLALARRGEVVREVVIDSDAPVAGLPGAATHRALARKMAVAFAPVVLLVDAHGQALADPIVGGDVAGLYGGYLDNAFDEAQRRLSR